MMPRRKQKPPMSSEVRLQDGAVDEVVAKKVSFHLEQLDDGIWWIGLRHADGTVDHIRLFTARGAKISATVDLNQ